MNYPVSVIIPAHNAAQTLERAVTSAVHAGALEIVIVDDASTDYTHYMGKLLGSLNASAEVSVVHSGALSPSGVCHARNLGISRARYDYIIPLDADDAFTLNGIETLYQAREEHSVVYGSHIAESGELVSAPSPERLSQKNLTGATYGFWREDWARAGGYHPDFNLGCEDWAFMAALVSAGVQLIRVDAPVYIYASGGTRAARCMRYADAIRQLLREHYPGVFDDQPGH